MNSNKFSPIEFNITCLWSMYYVSSVCDKAKIELCLGAYQGQFMPHLSHGEIITNVPTTVARGGIQAFFGHFMALWSSQQYTEGTQADAYESGVICVFTHSSMDSQKTQRAVSGKNREMSMKTDLPGKNNPGTGKIFLSHSCWIDLEGYWQLTPKGYLKVLDSLNELMCQRCCGQAAAGKMISALVSDRKDAQHCSAMCYFPSSCRYIFLGDTHVINNGITVLF